MRGNRGKRGHVGPRGIKGEPGIMGPVGSPGEVGPMGPPGQPGFMGPAGPQVGRTSVHMVTNISAGLLLNVLIAGTVVLIARSTYCVLSK